MSDDGMERDSENVGGNVDTTILLVTLSSSLLVVIDGTLPSSVIDKTLSATSEGLSMSIPVCSAVEVVVSLGAASSSSICIDASSLMDELRTVIIGKMLVDPLDVDIHRKVVGNCMAGSEPVPLPVVLPPSGTSPILDCSSSSMRSPGVFRSEVTAVATKAGVEVPESIRLPRVRGACRLSSRSTASFCRHSRVF